MNAITPLSRRAFLSRALPAPVPVQPAVAAGLEPFSPSTDQPWNPFRVAHLLRRTGFGAPPAQVQTFLTMSPADAVDAIVDAALALEPPALPDWINDAPPPNEAPEAEKDAYYEQNQANKLAYRADWVRDMPAASLRDRMALFWSNHFVTQQSGYGLAPYMAQYLHLLRTQALGNVKTLTYEVGLLPAMLLYLNGQQNHKNGPNENYARELCELFTLGITDASGQPNYTQTEITELARALTGWRVDRQALASYFEPLRFDDGEKLFFGQQGNFGYDDVIDILFDVRADTVAHFICTKLYREFVFDTPDPEIVDELAALLIAENFEVAPVLRTLLKSAHFFDTAHIGAKIKSPVDYMQCLVTETGMEITDEGFVTLFRYGRNLSQSLFDPPNVAGWPGNHAWLSTGTLPLRWNYANSMIKGYSVFETLEPVTLAKQMSTPGDPYLLARDLADAMFAQPLSEEDYDFLAGVLLDGTPDYEWDIDAESTPNRLRNFLAYLFQLPEYQLC